MRTVRLTKILKNLLTGICLFLSGALLPAAAHAANKKILVYYCTCDAWGIDLENNFVAALQADPTNTVTKIDASDGCTPGTYYCPGANATSPGPNGEIWNNYDQVWDVRYVNTVSSCPPAGGSIFSDYFGPCWQTTAVDYVSNYCGSIYLQGENPQQQSRWYGNEQFFQTIGGVGAGFVLCPTGANANAYGGTSGNQPVNNLPGASSVYFADEGGIPDSLLNGTSFVDFPGSTYPSDPQPRSAAAGWSGSAQMTKLTGCNVGKVSTFFDMDGWAGLYPDGGVQPTYAQALANWFGVRNCVCGTPTPTPTVTPTNTPGNTPTNTPTDTPSNTPTPFITNTPTNSPTNSPTNTPSNTPTPPASISISETVSETNAQPGDTLTYTINVTVTGGSANNLVITDPLASSVTFLGFVSSPVGTTSGLTPGTGNLTWTLPTPLAPGTYQIVYQVKVQGSFASGTIKNTATATDAAMTTSASVSVSVTSTLHVWPNPFNPNYAVPNGNGERVLRASVVPAGSTMSFYSVSGELVIQLGETTPGEIDWDGRNKMGVLVSTGTYYYVIQNNNTTLLTGKVLVLASK